MRKSALRRLAVVAVYVGAMIVGLAGCSSIANQTIVHPLNAKKQPALLVVEQYLSALNRRDLLVLTAYVAPDVEWYSVVNGERILEVSGREALTQTLQRYFQQNSDTRWTIEDHVASESFVAIRERSQWRGEPQGRDQSGERIALCVYEILNGRIRRMSYFLNTP